MPFRKVAQFSHDIVSDIIPMEEEILENNPIVEAEVQDAIIDEEVCGWINIIRLL